MKSKYQFITKTIVLSSLGICGGILMSSQNVSAQEWTARTPEQIKLNSIINEKNKCRSKLVILFTITV